MSDHHEPVKGMDYTGVTVSFFCHDGAGNFVMHRRTDKCRDEHWKWDFGGGGLKFGEKINDAVYREVQEEYVAKPQEVEFLGWSELFREHEGRKTHWLNFRYKVRLNRDNVQNGEPHKHDKIGWFTLNSLPDDMHSVAGVAVEEHKDKLT